MHIKRSLSALVCLSFIASVLISPSSRAAPQDEPQTRRLMSADTLHGKQLLEAGDAAGATKLLGEAVKHDARDSAAWHYLGLALAREGNTKEARDALDRAVELRTNAFSFEFNTQRKQEGNFSNEEGEARRLRFAAVTKELAESIESFLAVAHEDEEFWREWIATLQLYAQLSEDSKYAGAAFNLGKLATRAVITWKPEPQFTEDARGHHISGTIRLRAMLGADGKVKGVTVIKGLSHGLTENCIEAARRMTFTPATVGGRPVSQLLMLEYNFNTY